MKLYEVVAGTTPEEKKALLQMQQRLIDAGYETRLESREHNVLVFWMPGVTPDANKVTPGVGTVMYSPEEKFYFLGFNKAAMRANAPGSAIVDDDMTIMHSDRTQDGVMRWLEKAAFELWNP